MREWALKRQAGWHRRNCFHPVPAYTGTVFLYSNVFFAFVEGIWIMSLFRRKTAFRKEVEKLEKDEIRYCMTKRNKTDSAFNRIIEEKVPDKVQGTLDKAFNKAFSLVFEKGTVLIEKTYNKERIEREFRVKQYSVDLKANKKSLQKVTKEAGGAGKKNFAISGAAGIGMGIFGIAVPDIAIFTSMMLKSVYEIALHYGFEYESETEKFFVLNVLQGALTYGEKFEDINYELNMFIETGEGLDYLDLDEAIEDTSKCLSGELLYMKMLQNIPVAGVIGGAYDGIYMKRITEYAELKYRRRFLYSMAE